MTSKRSVDEEEIDNISINDEESSENVSATERLIGGGGPRRRSSDNADGDAGGRWRSTLRAFVEKIKKPGRYALGVSFILLVVAIWVSSSGLIQVRRWRSSFVSVDFSAPFAFLRFHFLIMLAAVRIFQHRRSFGIQKAVFYHLREVKLRCNTFFCLTRARSRHTARRCSRFICLDSSV
jgi:hypothetical protein